MNIWSKMVTALRGGVNEAGEAVVDAQALRILDQEIRDATEELKRSKDSLAAIIAHKKLSEEKRKQYQASISEYEGYAKKALDKNDEALALDVAQKIADLENQLAIENESEGGHSANAESLRHSIIQAEQGIKRLKQQVDTVKATENVQRAQAAVAERHSGSDSKLRTAMESLDRIKEKQAMKSAQMNAAKEMEEESVDSDPLRARLEAAGIVQSGSNAQEVLDRLKAK